MQHPALCFGHCDVHVLIEPVCACIPGQRKLSGWAVGYDHIWLYSACVMLSDHQLHMHKKWSIQIKGPVISLCDGGKTWHEAIADFYFHITDKTGK